jgi:hypothetical protein
MRKTEEVDWEKNVTMMKVAETNLRLEMSSFYETKNMQFVHYTVTNN